MRQGECGRRNVDADSPATALQWRDRQRIIDLSGGLIVDRKSLNVGAFELGVRVGGKPCGFRASFESQSGGKMFSRKAAEVERVGRIERAHL